MISADDPTVVGTDPPRGAATVTLERGTLVDRYTVLGTAGSGGMGTVYHAYDSRLGREVALKMLRPDRASVVADPDATARLVREARAMARLSHPNVMPVFDVDTHEGGLFIAMEYVPGQTLRERFKEPASWHDAIDLYLEAGRGLTAAHDSGIVHRDFKPANVLVGTDGRVRVMDFGLATPVEGAFEVERSGDTNTQSLHSSEHSGPLTQTGLVMGTPSYMAPELEQGAPADARSDQYAFCVALYEALYGVRLFRGRTRREIKRLKLSGNVPIPPGSRVPRAVERIVLRGLAPRPELRWPSMHDLLRALERCRRGNQRYWFAAVGFAAVGASVAGLSLNTDDPCNGGETRIDDIWSEERQERLGAAFGGGPSYGVEVWRMVQPRLEAHLGRWGEAYRDACEATHLRNEQSPELLDRRMSCLNDRFAQTRALLDLFAQADETTVEKSALAVASLPKPDRCADTEALSREIAPPPPSLRPAIDDLRARIADARALQRTGKYGEGLEAASSIESDVVHVDYPPIQAESALLLGILQRDTGDYPAAEKTLERAFYTARTVDQVEVALQAAMRLIYVVGVRQGQFDQAWRWVRHAEPEAKRIGEPWAMAGLLTKKGDLTLEQGRYEESERHYREALAIQEASLGDNVALLADTHHNLGNAIFQRGRMEEALQHHRQALELREKALGPAHPELAGGHTNIAMELAALGRDDEAKASYERALKVYGASVGADHPDVAAVLVSYGAFKYERGDFEGAITMIERAHEIFLDKLGPDHSSVGLALLNLAAVVDSSGDRDRAAELYARARENFETSLGPNHPNVGTVLNNEALLRREQGDGEKARELHERALEILEPALGDHTQVADSLLGLARIELDADQPEKARAHAERALQIRQTGDVPPYELAAAQFIMARTLGKLGENPAEAERLATSARQAYAQLGQYPGFVSEIDTWLEAR